MSSQHNGTKRIRLCNAVFTVTNIKVALGICVAGHVPMLCSCVGTWALQIMDSFQITTW